MLIVFGGGKNWCRYVRRAETVRIPEFIERKRKKSARKKGEWCVEKCCYDKVEEMCQ